VLLDHDGHVRIADFGMCKLEIYLDKTAGRLKTSSSLHDSFINHFFSHSYADSFCGTPDYMSPEIIKVESNCSFVEQNVIKSEKFPFIQGEIFDNSQGLHYNQSVDWWSFGVLLYEMLIGQSPFSGCDEDELFWSICNEIPWYPHYLSKDALKCVQALLEKDVTLRLGSVGASLGDVKSHPFFSDINWERLERREMEPPFKPQVVSFIFLILNQDKAN
jgi:novel protein kinase C delta type